MPKEIKRARIIARGKVQGVGFRYFVLQKAQELRVLGFTQNLPTGEVETIVEGDESAITELYRSIQRGPNASKVEEATIYWQEPKTNFRTFEIKR